jgi:hypothetical protein
MAGTARQVAEKIGFICKDDSHRLPGINVAEED